MAQGSYLMQRGGRFYYYRRVPRDVVDAVGTPYMRIALKTDSADAADRIVSSINETVESYWAELRLGGEPTALRMKYDRAVSLALRLGWVYRPLPELVREGASELLERLEALPSGADPVTVGAVLGAFAAPQLMLSDLVAEYEALVPEAKMGKSDDQIRRWRNPRSKAVANLIRLVGDKALGDVTRDDALALREWWVGRLQGDERLVLSSANKDFTH